MYNKDELTVGIINKNIAEHVEDISKEFRDGFEFLKKYPKSVSIFGSSRLTEASSHYSEAKKLAERIVKELDYTVVTGGGPGIMEAANMGAKEALGRSVGLNINIEQEQKRNSYTSDNITFDYFFTRKTMLNFAAETYVFFPGGYGTFDELFSILTLIQTNKIPKVPIILFGKDFWIPFKTLIKDQMFDTHHVISKDDLELFVITDSMDTIIEIIKNAPISEWWKMAD